MTLLPYAAAERSGSGILAIHHRSAGAHHLRPRGPSEAFPYDATADGRRSGIPIETIALDDLAADGRIPSSTALIWMDAQGAEARIIAGASRLISRAIPVVSEIAPKAMKNANPLRSLAVRRAEAGRRVLVRPSYGDPTDDAAAIRA